ncbi:MAG: cyclodeaminase/cyclohydrolase family protein [Caldisericia bacterium]|nr:cyclodeaminase/cyclohydrolase family protein [Caldisericia bacterium]
MYTRTLEEYLNLLSSPSPTPGGGSVGDLMLSFSASLLSMVCGLSKGVETYIEDLKKLRDEFYNLSIEDEESFNLVMNAYKLPKESDEEKKIRKEKIQEALKKATETPFKSLKLAKNLIPFIEILLKEGNKNAISDIGVAILSLKSGALSSYLNVKINLNSIKDDNFVNEISNECEKIKNEILEFAERSFKEVLNILNQ